jgi:integrase
MSADIDQKYASDIHRWQTKNSLNKILFILKEAKYVETQFLNVPQQVPRHLVTTLDGITATDIQAALHLQKILSAGEPPAPPQGWEWDQDVWAFLVFYASLVLVSFVLLKKLPHRVLSLRNEDLRQAGWIGLPQFGTRDEVEQGRRVLLHFPLSPSTQRHLARLKHLLGTPRLSSANGTADIFPKEWAAPKWQQRVLNRAWMVFVTHLLSGTGIPMPSYSMKSLVETGKVIALISDIPPFIVGVNSSQIPASPITEKSFNRIFVRKPSTASSAILTLPGPPLPRRPRSDRPTSEDLQLLEKIEKLRLLLRRDSDSRRRRDITDSILALIPQGSTGHNLAALDQGPIQYNTVCYGRWLISLLRGRHDNGSVATRASAIADAFFPSFAQRPLSQWSAKDWIDAAEQVLEDHETSASKASLVQFRDFLVTEGLTIPEHLEWNAKSLHKPRNRYAFPLVGFDDFDRALLACTMDFIPEHLCEILRVKMILGFYGGLRSMEATFLELQHLIPRPEPLLEIRITKTPLGVRNLYLERLMPNTYLEEVMSLYYKRMESTHGDLRARLLATEQVSGYDSSYLASLAGMALRSAIPEPMCFHHLRHAFASWYLLRWLTAINAIDLPSSKFSFTDQAVFREPLITGLRQLLFGFQSPKLGQDVTSPAIVVLSRLLGHSSPVTSISSYCHTTQIVTYLLMHHGRA